MIINDFKYKNKLYWCITVSSCDANIDLESDIKDFLKNNYSPESIILFQPDNSVNYEIAKHRIPNFGNINIAKYKYNDEGDLIPVEGSKKLISSLRKKIVSELYTYILKKNDAVLKAGHESYFTLPSGNCATHFLRVANIFKDSQDINILSIFLLPLLKNNPEIIYCDTPTIFSLAYSCVLLKNVNSKKAYNPRIKFYSSHSVNKDDIENTDNSIFLVSTSINGLLPRKLNVIGVDWSKIIVLYGFEKGDDYNYQIINKLDTKDISTSDFESLNSIAFKEKFPLRTFEIKLENEQFIPTAPTVSQILLRQEDAPQTLSEFMYNYLNYDFISCYKGINSKGKTRDIYFDVSKLLLDLKNPSNYFERKTNKLLINQLPINISKIVYVDKFESEYIANMLAEYYLKEHSKEIETIHYSELTFNNIDDSIPSCYLICSSCISDGKKISDVSRKLRSHDNSQILYFNGFVRCVDDNAYKNLKSAIKYGNYGFTTYNFITIDEILLPNEDSDTITWESEKTLINTLINGFDEFDVEDIMTDDTREYFKIRLDDLNSTDGLVNNVFLNRSNGDRILLNKNFAFFNFGDWNPEDIQQSKVYFTIISVIHNYRIKYNIRQTVYERFLLDPENFNRYNDGIIQACLLRSASKKELNYFIDSKASSKMATIISSSICDVENIAAAPYEFLMAMCIGKLTLCTIDFNIIYEKFINHDDNIIKCLLKIAKQKNNIPV